MGYVNEDDTLELIRCIKGQLVELTAAQYAALPASEKNNGSIYFVTDEDGGLRLDDEPTANSGRAVKSGGIYTYTSKIGSGSLTTTAQTLIPAVNELKSGVDTLNNDLVRLKSIALSGKVDANGDIAVTGLTEKDYPITFMTDNINSYDIVLFFDGSISAGYQKFAHFMTKRSIAVTGTVIYISGNLSN